MDIFKEIFLNVNTWLVVLATGALVWFLRQAVSKEINGSKVWRIFIRISPVLFGGCFAAIPNLHPLPTLSQSIAVGIIGGSFSSGIYEVAREVIPQRFRAWMGSRVSRMSKVGKDGE